MKTFPRFILIVIAVFGMMICSTLQAGMKREERAGLTHSNAAMLLSFHSQTDMYYQIWTRDSLVTGDWNLVGMRLGLSGKQGWSDTQAVQQVMHRFYRIVPVPMNESLDADGDGLMDTEELILGLDPLVFDSRSETAGENGAGWVYAMDSTTLYIDSSIGDNSYDGLSPAVGGGHGPKSNIWAAVDVATSGDRIEIAEGTYGETGLYVNVSVTLAPQGVITLATDF